MATDENEQHSSSGGAAANAGVEFQQRVAAWFLVVMHCGANPKALLDLPESGHISAVRFEARSPIDDVVLVTSKPDEVFLQVKRRVSLSEAPNSDFVNALGQFVRQFAKSSTTGHYVLAVSTEASGKVRTTLRKLLDALRLDPDAWSINPLSKAEEDCISTFRGVVRALFEGHVELAFDDQIFVVFSRRVFIREFAFAAGLEAAALMMLGKEAKVPPELLWGYLIEQSLRFAAGRASVTRSSLNELIAPYFNQSVMPTPELTMKLAVKMSGNMPGGREVVMIEGFPEENDIAIAEFYRFEADGYKRLRFKGDLLFWIEDEPKGFKVMHRSATMEGMQRWLEKHQSQLAGRQVYMIPANDIESEVHSAFARAHAALLDRMAAENLQPLKCLHCGKPISQVWNTLVEVDDEDNPHQVGTVHDDCLRPVDRTIGRVQCPGFEGREYLKKFDVDRWVELRLRGQGGFSSDFGTREGKPLFLAWNRRNQALRENSYCVEISLSDGTTRLVTSRGALDRYDFEEATKRANFMRAVIQKAAAQKDPLCFTSVNFAYGPESLVVRMKEPDETLIEWVDTKVVRYTVALGRQYESGREFYAPLCRLIHADTEKPVLLRGCQLVLTDPFRLPDLMRSWRNAGLTLPEYEMRILESDDQVDRWFSQLFDDGEEPIIDPVCDRNGSLIGGFFVVDASGFENRWR